jgi:hypothetical protein
VSGPTYLQGTFGNSTGATTCVVAYASNVTANSLLRVYVHNGNGVQPISVTDNNGNDVPGGTAGQYKQAIAGGSGTYSVWYALAGASGSTTVTVTWASGDNFGLVAIDEYSGIVYTTDPLDGTPVSSGVVSGANPVTSGNLTTTASGDLLCGLFFDSSQGVGTSNNGFTIRQSIQFGQDGIKDAIAGAPGSYAAISSTGGGTEWAICVAFFAIPPPPPVLGRQCTMMPVT